MLFEDILWAVALFSGIFFIGVPSYKLIRAILPAKKINPLEEARLRLEEAKLSVEAAKLDKEAQKLYDHLYEEALQDDQNQQTDQQEKHK
jgi:hypothetical protein